MRIRTLVLLVVVAGLGTSCNSKSLRPGYCKSNADCSGSMCDTRDGGSFMCVSVDGGTDQGKTDGGDGGSPKPFRCDASMQCLDRDAAAPICAVEAGSCFGCLSDHDCPDTTKPICGTDHVCRPCNATKNPDCAAHPGQLACVAGSCVECASSAGCTTATAPICGSDNKCHACQADSECVAKDSTAPGICMSPGDGHCATSAEAIYVQFSASGCTGATGSAGSPYCAPNDGVAQLQPSRSVIIIVGAANSQMTLNTTSVSPVIVGRKDSGNNVGSILAGASTAITVSAGTVLIRDLTVDLGATAASKGIVATGTSTKVTLLRVISSLGTGVGIDAESGAELHMDRVLVQNGSAGGVLINGARYEIVNSIIANNNYGVQFSASASAVAGGMGFNFNTLVGNGAAASCDPSQKLPLTASIIAGTNLNCMIANSLTTAPAFDTARPYHLTAKTACPNGDPSLFPPDDFDGDSRADPLDCGADQYFATP